MTKETIIQTLVGKNLAQDNYIKELEAEAVELRKEVRRLKLERASLLLCVKETKEPQRLTPRLHSMRATTDRILEEVLKVAEEKVKSVEDIKSKRRLREFVEARFISMYLYKEFTTMTFKSIGRDFGRDHTTVIHACKTIRNLMQTDQRVLAKVNECIKNLISNNLKAA